MLAVAFKISTKREKDVHTFNIFIFWSSCDGW